MSATLGEIVAIIAVLLIPVVVMLIGKTKKRGNTDVPAKGPEDI